MSKLQKLFKLGNIQATLSVCLLVIFIFFGFFLSVNTNAQKIGVKPYNEAGQDRGLFQYILNSGETVSDAALIINGSDFDGKGQILAKDSLVDTSGNISFKGNEEENTGTGNWLKLSQNVVDIPAKRGVKVPFTLTVPQGTPSGEYAAGIVVSPLTDSNTSSGVALSARSAITVYITVKGDLKLDNKLSDLSVVNPTQPDFAEEVDKRGFIRLDNMVLKFKGENLGNIYSRLNSKITYELPNGDKKEIPFKRNLNLNNTEFNYFYVNSNLPYTVGTTKVIMEFTSSPYNFEQEENYSKSSQSDGRLEYSFTLTQADLERFKNIAKEIEDRNNQDYGPRETEDFLVKDSQQPVVEVQKETDMKLVVILGVIILILVIGFIGYIFYSKSKNKELTEEKLSQNSQSKDKGKTSNKKKRSDK